MFFFGIAFAFKLQPLWLAPMLVILWVNKRVDLKHFLWLPLCYFVGIIPAWIAGKPLGELLTIYISQTQAESWSLALKYGNLYYLIGETGFIAEYHSAGVWLTLGVFMIVLYYIGRKKLKINAEFILLLGGFVGLLAPFFLPQMHERYSFFAEVFLILYVYDLLDNMVSSIKEHSKKRQSFPKRLRSAAWHLLIPFLAALITSIAYQSTGFTILFAILFGVDAFFLLIFLCDIYEL